MRGRHEAKPQPGDPAPPRALPRSLGRLQIPQVQEITVRAIRPRSDRRPESWTPIEGSIRPGPIIEPSHGWSTRRQRVAALGETTMCDLIRQNHSGSGPDTPSLGVVRVAEPPTLLIDKREANQLDAWRQRASAIRAQRSLFEDPSARKPDFEVVPWRFRYAYRCHASACDGHKQTVIDWEAVALWRKIRIRNDWRRCARSSSMSSGLPTATPSCSLGTWNSGRRASWSLASSGPHTRVSSSRCLRRRPPSGQPRKSARTLLNASGRSTGTAWPAPSITIISADGIRST